MAHREGEQRAESVALKPRRVTAMAAALSAVLLAGSPALVDSGGSPAPAGTARAYALAPVTSHRLVRSTAAGSSRGPLGLSARPRGRQRLSLGELAGQRVIYAYAGLRPPASLMAVIRHGEAAGVILFGPNIISASQIRAVIGQFQAAALASPLHTQLLILTDQEGGQVRRLPGAPTLSEKQIGASADRVALASSAGAGAAQTLAAVGVNVNLAPVLDVYRQPGDFIDQYERSYSNDPDAVTRLGGAFAAAQQHDGVAATAKHFPGLGAAAQSQNTDVEPVTLNASRETLRAIDEAPYRKAIAAGVKLIMTSWAVYPALDPQRPAGLSPTIIRGELRQRLGFRGVTITDGMDAGAVTAYGDLAARSILAAGAGADLLLCAATNPQANTPQLGIRVLRALTSALAHHQLGEHAARQAAARIVALRQHP